MKKKLAESFVEAQLKQVAVTEFREVPIANMSRRELLAIAVVASQHDSMLALMKDAMPSGSIPVVFGSGVPKAS